MAIPLKTFVVVTMHTGETIQGEVAMSDQGTYLCLRRENETMYIPWNSIKCARGPALPEKSLTAGYVASRP